ncbi:hypothetical protein [Acutalibacter muris]|uniref:hypothetical protein n=1 Tax=Acutalibacter muris TaxID=1796620 RepID=UPI001C3EC11D|nr:hypothetical protein [Acutalibacter muris]
MSLTDMYSGLPFSPQVALAGSISETADIIPVTDISAFPEPPNYATIGIDEGGETILYTAKAGMTLSGCVRGVEGIPRAWRAGETIARNFTNRDLETLQKNIRSLHGTSQELSEVLARVHQQIEGLAARTALTIPAEGWLEIPSGGATLDLPIEGVTGNMTPVVTLSAAALETASACELRETCETLPGAVRFWAGSAPGEEMSGELLLILPYGGTGGGALAVTVATDSEVEEMLDAVFGGG